MNTDIDDTIAAPQDTKKVFWKLGTCSRTFFFLLNREFGHLKEREERAIDPLAGGIMQKGHQCGMLWGSAMAVGAESYRTYENSDEAMGMAIAATQHILKSFSGRTETVNCKDITRCDFTSKLSMAKYFFSGRFLNCFKLAEKWAPEAIQSAREGLALEHQELPKQPVSCAAEVARKMGADYEEMVMVAGFAGGLGLSGNACGALSAAIWMNTLSWCRTHEGKSSYPNTVAKRTLKAFHKATDSEMLCHNICGKRFDSIKEHADFIKNGGCHKLINILAQS